MSSTMRTDAGVLERRQAERRWSGREQDGVVSEHNGALPNLIFKFFPCVRVEKHEHFLFSSAINRLGVGGGRSATT